MSVQQALLKQIYLECGLFYCMEIEQDCRTLLALNWAGLDFLLLVGMKYAYLDYETHIQYVYIYTSMHKYYTNEGSRFVHKHDLTTSITIYWMCMFFFFFVFLGHS